MAKIAAIALGGALGALSRYWLVGLVTSLWGREFPFGTLAVNVTGSFAIGVMYVLIVDRLGAGAGMASGGHGRFFGCLHHLFHLFAGDGQSAANWPDAGGSELYHLKCYAVCIGNRCCYLVDAGNTD